MAQTQMTPQDIANTNAIWTLLSGMSSEVKDTIYIRLRNIREKNSIHKDDWARKFEGAWKDSRSPEQIIESIRNDRTQNKEINL